MKSEREKQNLLKWIGFYTEQIKDMEKKLYLNSLKTYINTSQSSSPVQQSQSSQFPQQSQPSFKSLDEYFKYEKKQKNKVKFYYLSFDKIFIHFIKFTYRKVIRNLIRLCTKQEEV